MRITVISALTAVALMIGTAHAQTALERENAELKERIDRLESDVSQLKSQLEKPRAPEEKPALRSKFGAELYGFIKGDAAYMTARANDAGNYARWIESEELNKDDDQFNLTARESRFGFMLQGPTIDSMQTGGRIEMDFYEGGAENKNRPMMRHAYLQLDWPKSGWSVLAGQTSDVVSPLWPDTLNYSVGWWVGNIGYRRPQFRGTKTFTWAKDIQFQAQVAIARTIGHFGPFNPEDSAYDTGKDAGFPTVQARYAVSFPLFNGKKSSFGVSGHWGEEEYDKDATGDDTHMETWSACADILIVITDWLTLKGEYWTGRDLDSYLGGVGQGVVIETTDGEFLNGGKVTGTFIRDWSVASMGGWGNVVLGPWNGFRSSLGYSVDHPDSDDVLTRGRTRNYTCWGMLAYDINPAVRVGVELSWWGTKYRDLEDGDALRAQTSMIFRF
ncbi:MAG: hypothetical protein AB1640_12605 [bacterium]